jgi:malonate-semialdehyde dehydrogenase (acetylating)/methylmalonate-semialdehyde dehydrogenase
VQSSTSEVHSTDPLASDEAPYTVGHWIDGEIVVGDEDRRQRVIDPATAQVIGHVALADDHVVDAAVASSLRALVDWKLMSLSRRMAIMRRLRALVADHADELTQVIAREHGKVLDDAAGEIHRGLEILDLACSAPVMLKGEYSAQVATAIDTYSVRQPVGVCVGITPFNFPAMVPLWMFPIALACGNTFILKPSERDPSASLILARLIAEAGVPAGVFNVVQGGPDAVMSLILHDDVSAVSFVGSTPVAREIYRRAADAGKRVQALGGAKNHVVVMPDADLDQAADAVVSAAFGSAGQRCMAISVAVAVGPIADTLIDKIRTRVADIKVGPASDPDSEMGPLITADARDRVTAYVDRGVSQGATLVADGRDVTLQASDGHFLGPTIFDNVKPGTDLYDDEVFGPILGVTRVDSLSAAVDLIARNRYGNGAAIFTSSGVAAREFQRSVEAGMVGINVPVPVPVGYYSFGGWGDSLFGDTHLYGPEGFHFYTRGKVVTSRWPDNPDAGVSLAFPMADSTGDTSAPAT